MRTIIIIAIVNLAEAFFNCLELCKSHGYQVMEDSPECLCILKDKVESPYLGKTSLINHNQNSYKPVVNYPYTDAFSDRSFYFNMPTYQGKKENIPMYSNSKTPSFKPLHLKNNNPEKKVSSIPNIELPLYLDVGIFKTNSDTQSYDAVLRAMDNSKILEKKLFDCINLHVLVELEKHELNNPKRDQQYTKKRLDLSDPQVMLKIDETCSQPVQIVKTSFEEIKNNIPRKPFYTSTRDELNTKYNELGSQSSKENIEKSDHSSEHHDIAINVNTDEEQLTNSPIIYVQPSKFNKWSSSDLETYKNVVNKEKDIFNDTLTAFEETRHLTNANHNNSKIVNITKTENNLSTLDYSEDSGGLVTHGAEKTAVTDLDLTSEVNNHSIKTSMIDFSSTDSQTEIPKALSHSESYPGLFTNDKTEEGSYSKIPLYSSSTNIILTTENPTTDFTRESEQEKNSVQDLRLELKNEPGLTSHIFDYVTEQYTENTYHNNQSSSETSKVNNSMIIINNIKYLTPDMENGEFKNNGRNGTIFLHDKKDSEENRDMLKSSTYNTESFTYNADSFTNNTESSTNAKVLELSKPSLNGELFFLFRGYSIPAWFVQNGDGNIHLGIDGVTLCDKILENGFNNSIIMSTLCKCSKSNNCNFNDFKMENNNK